MGTYLDTRGMPNPDYRLNHWTDAVEVVERDLAAEYAAAIEIYGGNVGDFCENFDENGEMYYGYCWRLQTWISKNTIQTQ